MASFNRSTGTSSVRAVDPDNFILWKEGILKFESMELNRIVKKLERFYNVRFTFRDPMTGTQRISGKLELNEDLQEVLIRIGKTAKVKINRINGNLYEVKE
jgi:ferric-dicitrate binding protein FerR (iron transport regulator)